MPGWSIQIEGYSHYESYLVYLNGWILFIAHKVQIKVLIVQIPNIDCYLFDHWTYVAIVSK